MFSPKTNVILLMKCEQEYFPGKIKMAPASKCLHKYKDRKKPVAQVIYSTTFTIDLSSLFQAFATLLIF